MLVNWRKIGRKVFGTIGSILMALCVIAILDWWNLNGIKYFGYSLLQGVVVDVLRAKGVTLQSIKNALRRKPVLA